MNKVLSSTLVPAVLFKRYFNSTKEITKLKKVDSSLRPAQLNNTKVLADRRALLSNLKEGSICAEIGVASGDFSTQILEVCKPSKLHLIDYWADNKSAHGIDPAGFAKRLLSGYESTWDVVNRKFEKEIKSEQVKLHRGFSWDMMETFDDHHFDFVYIDAGHDYASVSKDLMVAKRKVKPDGIIAGHDYVRWGRFGYKCGVVEAVNEFCIKHDYEILYLTVETKTNASFAIRKIGA